jgi:beta-galactosidase
MLFQSERCKIGLPSWLSSDKNLIVRSSDPAYEARVKIYFDVLLPMIRGLTWSNGGPIVMVQVGLFSSDIH